MARRSADRRVITDESTWQFRSVRYERLEDNRSTLLGKCWASFLSLVVIVEDERGLVFETGRLKFFRYLAEGELNESFLQSRFFALCPGPENGFGDSERVAMTVGGLLVRDSLRQRPELVETSRPSASVNS
jgi:hypothetical protein